MSSDKKQCASKKRWQKILGIGAFVLLNAVVILVTAISEFGNSAEATELAKVKINFWLLVPAVLLFIVATIANVYKYVLMIRSSWPEDEPISRKAIWKLAWRVVMLGKYYDNITPAAIGGQPFQIYYMRKNSNLSNGAKSSVPIVGMIAGQIGFLIIAILCFLFGNILTTNPALYVTAWLGLLFFAFWPILVIGVNFFPRITTKILKFGVKCLAKIKIVKNCEKTIQKVEAEVGEYIDSVKTILKTRGLFLKVILLAVIYSALTMTIPFFVLAAFGGNVGFFESFALTIAVTSAVYFVPTPGNSGAAEGTFFIVFSALSTGYVFWAMLIWRFFSYYIYILMGLLIYLGIQFEKKRKKA
ncbi:MAG: lysylphosphatidylglycerol synthase transmembrane domain-containing protein [Candidatus Saccharibacteria bacterium]|nr:lysylphosphatidylglycerol synthase transmembrane domain-containing protein [Candidatus Saccharibacteria bacterium]